MPDQFVIIDDGRVIIGNAQSDMEDDQNPPEAPNPFSDTNRQPRLLSLLMLQRRRMASRGSRGTRDELNRTWSK